MPENHQAFAFGRITRDGQRVVVVRPSAPPPIPGPWELCAITTSTRSTAARPPRRP